MNERKKVSEALREMSRDFSDAISHTCSKEDIETAKYFNTLANKNDRGTLTMKEADDILDILGDLKLVVYRFEDYYWVEIAK